MVKPTLSIIIISYNTAKITGNCLRSIKADRGLTFDLNKTTNDSKIPTEIIVVDNASDDDSLSTIKKFKPHKIIANSRNLGFAKANNQGIEESRGNFLLFLNSDTIILHSAISQSLNWLSSNPQAIACTAQLLNSDKSIQISGGFFPNLINITTWSLGLDDLPFVNSIVSPLHPHTPDFYTHDTFFLRDHPQDWITGAYILIRRHAVSATKGFDESYFMYAEELEWFYRLKKAFPESQIWYLVGPQVIHLGGASSADKSTITARESSGILAFFIKHRPSWQIPLVRLLLIVNSFLRREIYRHLIR